MKGTTKKTAILAAVLVAALTFGGFFIAAGGGDKERNSARQQTSSAEQSAVNGAGETAEEDEKEKSLTNCWSLILVNQWNPVPKDYEVTTASLSNGGAVDERCYPALQQMLDDCSRAGLSPVVCSSYRTMETQESLFHSRTRDFINAGYSEEAAKLEAAKDVAVPGTSEHQLGLAVDIVDINYQLLDASQEKTEAQQWLMKHSWKYGFILRYPKDKSEITGIIYEPWHYRYVGKDAAKEIYEQGVCLEEYLGRAVK